MSSSGMAARVAVARAGIENLRPTDVVAELESGNALLVDVRGTEEAANGIIAGAIVVPRGVLEFRADPTLAHHLRPFASDRRLIIYCSNGSRSALAVQALHELGYTDVAHLDGGITAWLADGNSVEVPST